MRTETETEEGIAQAIVNSEVDFERDPWPKVSENAKDLVRSMLDPNPYSRLTAQEVLGMHFNYLWSYTLSLLIYLLLVSLIYLNSNTRAMFVANISSLIQNEK